MGFWPDVKRGDVVTHHMVLENNVRHLINSLNGFGAGAMGGGNSGVVRVQVWNASGSNLTAGQPVAFDSEKELSGEAIPVVKVTDVKKPWGVLVNALAARAHGDCIVAGPASVKLSGSSGDYAKPDTGGSGFKRADTGTARVLFSGSNAAVILLGGAGNMENYNGPFAITYDAEAKKLQIAAGNVNANGVFLISAAATIEPQSGTICVCTQIGDNGKWSTPEIKFADAEKYSYPIGSCKVEGSGEERSVTVCNYCVPVAIIIDAAECPLSAQADVESN